MRRNGSYALVECTHICFPINQTPFVNYRFGDVLVSSSHLTANNGWAGAAAARAQAFRRGLYNGAQTGLPASRTRAACDAIQPSSYHINIRSK